jgi:putative component of membrane protein insertase Oxa1/YidC/SpoIIIJ protein YidD
LILSTLQMKQLDRALSIMLGALLLLPAAAKAEIKPHNAPNDSVPLLTLELFEEANWGACRIECARETSKTPTAKIQLLYAVCGLRLGLDAKPELQSLCSAPETPLDVLAMAHYELGRAEWITGHSSKAFSHLHAAFKQTQSTDLHRRAGCSLAILLEEAPTLADDTPGLRLLLATCSKQWDRKLVRECSLPYPKKAGIMTAPARGLISFYQNQIGPAIGARCSLHPSCSRYASQALKKHGVIGIGMIGDRFIREPSVVGARKKPIMIHEHRKYRDPLSDHDRWLTQ